MAGKWSQLGDILSGMGQSPARVSAFLDSLDPATAARLMQAAEAGDNRALLKAMADQTWKTSPARPQPVGPGRGETREPVSGRQWTQRPDSYVRGQVQANSEMVPEELMARINAGEPGALEEAYRGIVGRMERAERAPQQATPPMETPASVEDSIRSLIPLGRRGPGVPVGSPYGGPPTGLIPLTPRGLPAPESMPPATLAQGDIAAQFDRALSLDSPRPRVRVWQEPPRGLGSDGASPMRIGLEGPPQSPRRSFDPRPAAAMAAGAGAIGAGLALMNQDTPSVTSTGGTADLAAETSPPPAVAEEEPADYSAQARTLINELNAMRRAAGGEVPQAPQMLAEINRLLSMGNEQRRQPTFAPKDQGSRFYKQAQNLMDRLNDMRREAGGEVPQAQQIMAEIRRLQSMGDQVRNAG